MYKYVLCGYYEYGWDFVHTIFFLLKKNKNGCTLFQRKVPNFDYDVDINDIFNDVDSEPDHDTCVVLDE